jgi:hypothetical protein
MYHALASFSTRRTLIINAAESLAAHGRALANRTMRGLVFVQAAHLLNLGAERTLADAGNDVHQSASPVSISAAPQSLQSFSRDLGLIHDLQIQVVFECRNVSRLNVAQRCCPLTLNTDESKHSPLPSASLQDLFLKKVGPHDEAQPVRPQSIRCHPQLQSRPFEGQECLRKENVQTWSIRWHLAKPWIGMTFIMARAM